MLIHMLESKSCKALFVQFLAENGHFIQELWNSCMELSTSYGNGFLYFQKIHVDFVKFLEKKGNRTFTDKCAFSFTMYRSN